MCLPIYVLVVTTCYKISRIRKHSPCDDFLSNEPQYKKPEYHQTNLNVVKHISELLLREEEEYLKLHMYVRDHRFRDLLDESGHRTELQKNILENSLK